MPAPPPPVAPDSLPAGWRRTEDAVETPYDGLVTVTARTRVYEDAALRERVHDATGVDFVTRFYLASRVAVSPLAGPPTLLRMTVARRSADAFVARLRDAGVRDVRERDAHAETVAGSRAFVVEYGGAFPADDATVTVAARLAAWVDGREFLLAGGAFPTGVRGESATATRLRSLFSPAAFRDDLSKLMDQTR
jgi:hypothetical protein